jgi:hypothetical protein
MYSVEELRRRKRRAQKQAKEHPSAKRKKVKAAVKKKQARPRPELANPAKPAKTSGKKMLKRKTSSATAQQKSTGASKNAKRARGK